MNGKIKDAHDLATELIGIRVLEHRTLKNADGTPQRFTITSVKTWKRDRNRFYLGLKRGLYQYESIDSIDEFFKHFDLPSGKLCTTCASVIMRNN